NMSTAWFEHALNLVEGLFRFEHMFKNILRNKQIKRRIRECQLRKIFATYTLVDFSGINVGEVLGKCIIGAPRLHKSEGYASGRTFMNSKVAPIWKKPVKSIKQCPLPRYRK